MVSTVRVAGMHAVHAVRAVTTALTAVAGITSLDVRLGAVTVEHDGRATAGALREAMAAAGFDVLEVTEHRRRLQIAPPDGGA
jgi:copper chaperone CopZ